MSNKSTECREKNWGLKEMNSVVNSFSWQAFLDASACFQGLSSPGIVMVINTSVENGLERESKALNTCHGVSCHPSVSKMLCSMKENCTLRSQAVHPEVLPDPNNEASTQCLCKAWGTSGLVAMGDIRSCCWPWKQAVNYKQESPGSQEPQVRHGWKTSKPTCVAALQPQLLVLIGPKAVKRAH